MFHYVFKWMSLFYLSRFYILGQNCLTAKLLRRENVCSESACVRDAYGENTGHVFMSVSGFFLFLLIYLSITQPAPDCLNYFCFNIYILNIWPDKSCSRCHIIALLFSFWLLLCTYSFRLFYNSSYYQKNPTGILIWSIKYYGFGRIYS